MHNIDCQRELSKDMLGKANIRTVARQVVEWPCQPMRDTIVMTHEYRGQISNRVRPVGWTLLAEHEGLSHQYLGALEFS
jgi:hypothetical protein